MKASLQWMKDYVAIPEGNYQELADTLTQAGIPVEEVISMGNGMKKIYTAKITAVEEHPNADALVVCQLDCIQNDGTKGTRQICTSATNVRPGQIVPVAYPKAKLPDGKKISRGKMRGVVSDGMMCSINELGYDASVFLPEETEGILILPNDIEIGLDIAAVMGLNDTVFEFELTPNRADCFSMIGLSREIAVMTGQTAMFPDVKLIEDGASVESMASVAIEAEDVCSRFTSRVVKNVKIGPSPLWMQNRLRNAGIRPINNVVDVTNYVMVEMGQPMHAYDYDKVAGHSLIARMAKEGEKLVTLDGEERELTHSMLVIADADKVVGVAGVMGGLDTEVSAKTTTVLLEAAVFNGKSIRRTARALGMRSEASGRFEKGVNAELTPTALDRAAQLLQEICSTAEVAPGFLDVYPTPAQKIAVKFTAEEINKHLGTKIEGQRMVEILESLGFTVTEEAGIYTANVPSWRNDVSLMCDIAEEVARIYGYDNIVPTTPIANLIGGTKSPMRELIQKTNHELVQSGMTECITFSFMHKDSLKKLGLSEEDSRFMAVPILNPISEEFPFMRTTLVPSLLETAYKNMAKKNSDLWLFETAAVYEPKALPVTDYVHHRQMVAGVMVGNTEQPVWPNEKRVTDFYDVKGMVEGLLTTYEIENYDISRVETAYLHPGISAKITFDGEVLATFGELHPEVCKAYKMPKNTYIFEIDLEKVLATTKTPMRFKEISKFPGMSRDLAIVAPKTVTSEEIESLIKYQAGELLSNVYLFDVYAGEHIKEGFRSLAYSLQFQSMERTLEEKEIDEAIQSVLAELLKINCTIR